MTPLSLHHFTYPPFYPLISITLWMLLFDLASFSVFHRPPSPWQWPTFLHALTIKIQLSSSVILWEHSELSSSDHGGVMSVPRHMCRSTSRLIGEKLLLTASYLVFIVHAVRYLNSWLQFDSDYYNTPAATEAGNYVKFAAKMRSGSLLCRENFDFKHWACFCIFDAMKFCMPRQVCVWFARRVICKS